MTIPRNDRDFRVRCDTLYTPFEFMSDVLLHISAGKIVDILPYSLGEDFETVYRPNSIVAPGFIDLHVHGARGRDLMDGSLESLNAVSSTLAAHGTTSFLATTLSAPDSDTEAAVRGLSENLGNIGEGAVPIGIHLEGPYLNPARRGTHNADYLRPADLIAFRKLVDLSADTIRKITVAPEMDPGLQVIREATARGIQVSLGHSDATLKVASEAIEAGALHATHTFNAMRPLHQREPGILGQVLTDPRVYAEVIADGVHVHPRLLGLLWTLKGPERTVLVTDGLSAVDMPDGLYPLGGHRIEVKEGVCRDTDGILAGSILTQERAVQNLCRWLDVPPHEAIAAAGVTPARSLNLGHIKGFIRPGADADLVFLDPELNVLQTMVAGRIVFTRS